MGYFKELFTYREMIAGLVHRELRGKYKGSVLGFFWTFLNPLLQLLVYTLVFSVIMRNGIEKYYIYLFVALVPWLFFSTSVNQGAVSVMVSADMVKKIYFPREVLPIACVTAALVNMLLVFLVIFVVLLVTGFGMNLVAIFYLPVIIAVEYLLCLGIALLFSSLTVYLRDLSYILNVVTMAWQFLTPVMYSIDSVPERLRPIFNLNPMTPVILAYRDILYFKKVPDLGTLVHATFLGVGTLVVGAVVFRHLQKGFAEEM